MQGSNRSVMIWIRPMCKLPFEIGEPTNQCGRTDQLKVLEKRRTLHLCLALASCNKKTLAHLAGDIKILSEVERNTTTFLQAKVGKNNRQQDERSDGSSGKSKLHSKFSIESQPFETCAWDLVQQVKKNQSNF